MDQSFYRDDNKIRYWMAEKTLPTPTLFIHGNIASRRWWHPLREHYSLEGAGSGTMIAADWRGCGESDLPEGELTLEDLVDDHIALLKSVGENEVFDVVGHSTGGLIVLLALHRAPEVFRRAILLDPVGVHGLTVLPLIREKFTQMTTDKQLVSDAIGATIWGHDPASKFFREVIVEDAFSACKRLEHKVLDMLTGINYSDVLRQISHPVVVFHGEYDDLLPIEDSRYIANHLAFGEFHKIDRQGHCANVEDAQKFAALLDKHLFV